MGRAYRLAGILLLGWMVTGHHSGRTAEPAAELTKERREQLESEAAKSHEQIYRYCAMGDLERATRCAEQALNIRERLYPREKYPLGHPKLADSIFDLAILHRFRSDSEKAMPLFERAVAMYETLYPKDRFPLGHPDLAFNLSNLGALHLDKGDLDKALPLLERAAAMYEALYPKDRYPQGHSGMAPCFHNLAVLYRAKVDLVKALPLSERAVAMYEALYPKDRYPQGHPELAASLENLAFVVSARGGLDKALPLLERAVAMYEALYPKDRYPQGHPGLADCVYNLAEVHRLMGDYGRARTLSERALAVNESLYPKQTYPKGHPKLAESTLQLASVHAARGDYARALLLSERSLTMNETLYPKEIYPKGHPDLAKSLNELATLYLDRGDLGKALPLYERALAMCEALYPKDRYPQGHVGLTACVNNLAELHRTRGDLGKALPLYERALAMCETLYPKDRYPQGHPGLAACIHNLAALHNRQGEYGRARTLSERALAVNESLYPKQTYPKGHPKLAESTLQLASVHAAQGDYARALLLSERSLTMNETLYPKDRYPQGHPGLAACFYNLAKVHRSMGDQGRALPLFQRALAMYEQLARVMIEVSSEAEALNFLASLPRARDDLVSLPSTRFADAAAYGSVWRGKSALGRLLQRRHRDAMAALDPANRNLFEKLQDTRLRLARFLLAPVGTGRDSTSVANELTARKERLERELAQAVPATADRDPGTPAELARRLPSQTAYVDLLRFTRFEQDRAKPGAQGETMIPSYVAFVLAPGAEARRVDLGPAQPIDAAWLNWRRALLDGAESAASAEVRRLVWDPLEREFPVGTRTVYVAPDWVLAGIPWAALPGAKSGTVLLEEYALAVVPHGPALLDALRPRERRPRGDDTLLTAGNVAYDQPPPAVVAPANDRGEDPPRQAERSPGASWGPLRATGTEAERVATLAAPRKVLSLSGDIATVSRLTAELPKARWAHLATHGFFADASFRSAFRLDERMYARTTLDLASPGARSPLLLSGLVLAGANRPDAHGRGDGGILIAEAIVGLDLSGMDLAVLSACETGLGEVARGEGVYGLQRAFHIAGCRDVVASLWKVNDEATAALMAVFYRKLWQENLPPIEALRQAQLTIYRHPEQIKELAERGWDTSKTVKLPDATTATPKAVPSKGKALAKLWAAFVLSGPGREYP